jgi:hypothetical protein
MGSAQPTGTNSAQALQHSLRGLAVWHRLTVTALVTTDKAMCILRHSPALSSSTSLHPWSAIAPSEQRYNARWTWRPSFPARRPSPRQWLPPLAPTVGSTRMRRPPRADWPAASRAAGAPGGCRSPVQPGAVQVRVCVTRLFMFAASFGSQFSFQFELEV